jgi:hypothetical protein
LDFGDRHADAKPSRIPFSNTSHISVSSPRLAATWATAASLWLLSQLVYVLVSLVSLVLCVYFRNYLSVRHLVFNVIAVIAVQCARRADRSIVLVAWVMRIVRV